MRINKLLAQKQHKLLFVIAINTSLVVLGGVSDSSYASNKLSHDECVESTLPEVYSIAIAAQKCGDLGFTSNVHIEEQAVGDKPNEIEVSDSVEGNFSTQTMPEILDENSPLDNVEENIDIHSVDEEFDENATPSGPVSISDDSSDEVSSKPSFTDLIFNLTEEFIKFGRQKLTE